MKNPLNYVSEQDLIDLGLSLKEIAESYQPSAGGVFHARGEEGKGKTLLIAHYVRDLIDKKIYLPSDGVGNITLKGKYGYGYQTLKGDDLRQYLWDLTHKEYKNKFVIIDEIDSEFPARLFTDKEQTEIALRMWHIHKLHDHIFMTSHAGNSTDLIFHLSSHYFLYPDFPNFENDSLDFVLASRLHKSSLECTAHDIVKTMLIYNRRELTEKTEVESEKQRPVKKQKRKELINDSDLDLDFDLEWEKGLLLE